VIPAPPFKPGLHWLIQASAVEFVRLSDEVEKANGEAFTGQRCVGGFLLLS
jgi:hypothetical protein